MDIDNSETIEIEVESSCDEIQSESDEPVSNPKNSSETLKRGRSKKEIWALFTEVRKGKDVKQKCNSCSELISPLRMKAHVEKCRKMKSNRNVTKFDFEIETAGKAEIQKKISEHLIKTTKEEKDEIDMLVAKFWFSCNLPFSAASTKYWKDLCAKLRPGYIPPSKDTMKDKLLDMVYDELQTDMKKKLNGKTVTIVQDGWSDIHNHATLTHTVVCEGRSFFINSIECEGESQTADYCANKLDHAINTVENQWNSKVVGGTTDNCNTMISMRSTLRSRHPDKLFYGCSSHALNNLSKDISSKVPLGKITEVHKFFRNNKQAAAILSQKGGFKPQLPGITRWISHLETAETFIKNRSKYVDISQMPGIVSPLLAETVNSLSIFNLVTDMVVQFKEIHNQILTCESDSANVADATHGWLTLLKSTNLKSFKSKILHRMKSVMETQEIQDTPKKKKGCFFFAAYLMHPKYRDELLSVQQRDQAVAYLQSVSKEFGTIANSFIEKDVTVFPEVWLDESIMSKSKPIQWWISMKGQETIPEALVDTLIQFYSCSASNASSERTFLTFNIIQTDIRNRLSHKTLTKLAYCFRTLRSYQ